jgi:hypothetical protein
LPQPELIQQAVELLTFESHQPTEQALAPIIQKMTLASELVRESATDKTHLPHPQVSQRENTERKKEVRIKTNI